MKFYLIIFIINMFVKAALLYSAMTVAVAVSTNCDESSRDDNSEKGLAVSVHSSPKSLEKRPTSADGFQSEVIPTSPATPGGIPGLVSPGYHPRGSSQYSP